MAVSQEGEYDLNTQSWVDFPGKDILMWESLLQVSGEGETWVTPPNVEICSSCCISSPGFDKH